MPIDHHSRLPLSATMATRLAALQLYISRQEGSRDVFFCSRQPQASQGFDVMLTLTLPVFTHDAFALWDLSERRKTKDDVSRYFTLSCQHKA